MSNDLGGLGLGGETQAIADSLLVDPKDEATTHPEETVSTESADTGDVQEETTEPEASQGAAEESAEPDEAVEGEESEEEPAADPESEERFELVVDGETVEVTLDELRNGYLRHSDYTRKRQADAREREDLERTRTQFMQEAQQRIQHLDGLAQQAQAILATNQRTPEQWEQLREEDPSEYLAQRERAQATDQWFAQVQHERAQAQQQQLAARIPKEREDLARSLTTDGFKDWATPEGFEREYARLGRFVTSEFGITPEEWNGTVDHRSIRIAYHAMRHIEATRQAAPLKERIKRVTGKPLRPGTPRQPEDVTAKRRQAALDRLKKGDGKNLDDVAAAIMS